MIVAVVEWIDSAQYNNSEWKEKNDENLSIMRMTTAGFVVKETDDLVAIALDYTPDNPTIQYRNVCTIPKVNIKHIHFVEVRSWIK